MTLAEFLKGMKEDLDKFEVYWKQNNKGNPRQWPNEMGAGDWDEQFRAWGEGWGQDPE